MIKTPCKPTMEEVALEFIKYRPVTFVTAYRGGHFKITIKIETLDTGDHINYTMFELAGFCKKPDEGMYKGTDHPPLSRTTDIKGCYDAAKQLFIVHECSEDIKWFLQKY